MGYPERRPVSNLTTQYILVSAVRMCTMLGYEKKERRKKEKEKREREEQKTSTLSLSAISDLSAIRGGEN